MNATYRIGKILLIGLALSFTAGAAILDRSDWPSYLRDIKASGFVDSYFSYNFNHSDTGTNAIHNYDILAGRPELNMAGLTLQSSAYPVGFRVDLGLGEGYRIIQASDASKNISRHFAQAYLNIRPIKDKDFEIDLGKFAANAGNEAAENYGIWNYSRSLCSVYLTPNYHTGVRITSNIGHGMSAGAYVVNGWNTFADNNSSKTVGVLFNLTRGPLTWSNNIVTGSEQPNNTSQRRTLIDTTANVQINDHVSVYVNYDNLRENTGAKPALANGVSAAARFSPNKRLSFSIRSSFLADPSQYFCVTSKRLQEISWTTDYKPASYMIWRFEYRLDLSAGNVLPISRGRMDDEQNTFLIGFILTTPGLH